MAKKEDLVQEILSITDTYTEDELMSLTNRQLVYKLNEVTKENKVSTDNDAVSISTEDIEKEIREKIEREIREKIEREIREKMIAENKPEKKKITEIDKYKEIPVMNLTNGTLFYSSRKTGAEWEWGAYGDITYMEFQELQHMRVSSKPFIYDPLFMILDDEVVNYLNLEKLYETILDLDDLEKVFKMNNNDFERFIEKAPKSIIVAVVTRAREKVEDNTMESMVKVNLLNQKFNTDIGKRG